MPELRFVAAAVLICSWACAGGDAPESSGGNGAQPSAQPEQPGSTSPAAAPLADDADREVLGGGESPITEGSNTNWRPTAPWLDPALRPPLRERPDPRKPAGNQQGNVDPSPDQEEPSTVPGEQESPSSSAGSSPGSSNSTPHSD